MGRTTLVRHEVRGPRSQVIVANAEQVLIVSSWREPFFWPELVDRCIIAAQRSGLLPIICEPMACRLESVLINWHVLHLLVGNILA